MKKETTPVAKLIRGPPGEDVNNPIKMISKIFLNQVLITIK